MINHNDYFAINWEATSDNLRTLIKDNVNEESLAEVLCVTERTIYNWCNNKSTPSIDNLMLISKIFNTNISDILVYNGQVDGPINQSDINKLKEGLEEKEFKNQFSIHHKYDFSFNYTDEIIFKAFLNEFNHINIPIKNLNEFILALPLLEPIYLADFLRRTFLNIGTDNSYVEKQLIYLYNQIPDDKAKSFFEIYKNFILDYPSIECSLAYSKLDLKFDKYNDTRDFINSPDFSELYDEYFKKLSSLIKN